MRNGEHGPQLSRIRSGANCFRKPPFIKLAITPVITPPRERLWRSFYPENSRLWCRREKSRNGRKFLGHPCSRPCELAPTRSSEAIVPTCPTRECLGARPPVLKPNLSCEVGLESVHGVRGGNLP